MAKGDRNYKKHMIVFKKKIESKLNVIAGNAQHSDWDLKPNEWSKQHTRQSEI